MGGGPFSILPEVRGGTKLVVDPTFYGTEIDQYYESRGVHLVPQPYETIPLKSKITILINTIESLENYELVLEHAIVLSETLLIAEVLPIKLYNDLLEYLTNLCSKHNKKLIIIDDTLFSKNALFVCKVT